MNDQQTIRKTCHLFELGGHEQDRAPVVTQTHELTMNELDRADVNAACRLRHEQQLRRNVIFTTDDQLLLVTARKRARRKCCVWWTNIETLNDLHRPSLHGVLINKNSARVSCDRRAIMNPEDHVFSETEVEQQPASMAIFRDMADSELAAHPRGY